MTRASPQPIAAKIGQMTGTRSFRGNLAATFPRWGAVFTVAAAATFWLAGIWDVQRMVQGVCWLAIGFVLLPVGFTAGLSAVAAVLTVLLSLLALPSRLLGRDTGLHSLLRELWGLPASILPGFWRSVRRVRRPQLWGLIAGFVAGTATFVAMHGLAPRSGSGGVPLGG